MHEYWIPRDNVVFCSSYQPDSRKETVVVMLIAETPSNDFQGYFRFLKSWPQ